MKVNHLLYKVDNLQESVAYYRQQGFSVEYGREKNPYNALIYFPEGPYVELIHNMNIPGFVHIFPKLFSRNKFLAGMISQENAAQGFIRICFECEKEMVDEVCKIYRKNKKKIMEIKVKRTDTKGRKLVCNTIFPVDTELPFVKTLFNNEETLHLVKHLNGAQRIIGFEYGVSKKDKRILESLNTDKLMKITHGNGIKHVLFETDKKEICEFK